MNINVTRQQKGLRLGLSYTWSKSLDNSSASIAGGTFNNDIQAPFPFFPDRFRGLSSFDVRQNLTFNYLWEIPSPGFAKEGALKRITNGWQLGGIYHARTGLPFTVTTGGDSLGLKNANAFNFPDRVNTPACADPINRNDPNNFLKLECFVPPSPGTRLGNAGRNQYIGPGLQDFDLSLIKNASINERVRLQFRTEIFNVFNHTNFGLPDRTTAQLYSFTNSTGLFTSTGARKLNSTSTTLRQIQFALKLTF